MGGASSVFKYRQQVTSDSIHLCINLRRSNSHLFAVAGFLTTKNEDSIVILFDTTKMGTIMMNLLALAICISAGIQIILADPSAEPEPEPTAVATCPEADQIHCKDSDRCTRVRYVCDGDNDCGDNSDEDSALCRAWRNSDCERNSAQCTRNGRSDCVTISTYCTTRDPPCEGSVDPRICQMLRNEMIQDLDSIFLTTTPASTLPPEPTTPSIHFSSEDLTQEFKGKLDTTIHHADCPQLYTRIGDQCVSVFFIGNLTWLESRAFCQAIGGDLFTVRPNLSNFVAVLQHLVNNQITKDFWIGGMMKNESVGWQWLDESSLQKGSPIWAVRHSGSCSPRIVTSPILNITSEANDGQCYYYTQAPSDPAKGDCAAITYEHFYYVSDEDCLARKSPLCVLPDEHPKQAT